MKLASLLLVLLVCTLGCSSSTPPPEDAGTPGPDAGPPPDPTTAPQVNFGSGLTIQNPSLVTVTWSNDDPTFVSSIQDFGNKVAASSSSGGYWYTTTHEYGVGALNATTYTVPAAAAPSINDAQIQAFVKTLTPAPSGTSFYFLYYPATTSITGQGGGVLCANGVGGYHETLQLVGGGTAVVAVIPRCSDPTGQLSNLELATITASHELVEGVADPQGNGGYVGLSPAYIAFAAFAAPGAEIGDMCEYRYDSAYNPPDIGYWIQRTWSNASAAAGHDPCVPVPPTNNWFIASPLEPDYFEFYWSGGNGNVGGSDYGYAWGIRVPFGGSVTVPVHLLGDSTAPGTWTTEVYDTTGQKLTYSWDTTTGSVGDTLHLTINATNVTALANQYGAFVLDLHALYTPDGGTAAQQEVRQWFTFVQPYQP